MSKQTEQNSKDIAVLKEKIDDLCGDVSSLLNNHLPHVEEELRNLRENYIVFKARTLLIYGFVITIVTVIISAIVNTYISRIL